MSVLAQHLILSLKESFNGTHQRATLTGEVTCSLTLKGRLEQIAGTNTDTEGDCLLLGIARSILINGIGTVQTASLAEHCAERSSGTLRCYQNHIHILGRNHTCTVAPVDGKSVTIIQGLARSQILFDFWPDGNLTGIRKQHAEDCTSLCSLFDREERLSRYPSFSYSLLVGLSLTLTDNDIEAIVTQVACLTRSLNTIADNGNRLIL